MSVNLLLIFFVLIVVAMIAFILVQKGTGATAGSAFGAGASSTVFGAKGSGNFLTKTTMLLAFLFFAISMLMAINASKQFSADATGEVDLGVIGKLDTSVTDVPEIKSIDPVDSSGSDDMPSLQEKVIDKATEVKDNVTQGAGDIKDKIVEKSGELKDKAVEVKDNVVDKVIDAKDATVEKAIEVKDATMEKAGEIKEVIEEKADEAKEAIDG